jgi:hypothetical protein
MIVYVFDCVKILIKSTNINITDHRFIKTQQIKIMLHLLE